MMAAVSFEDVVREAGGLRHMSPREGRHVYDHLRRTSARDVLEVGTAHGVGTAYMAAALEDQGEGTVTTVDRVFAGYDPPPGELLERLGLSHRVRRVAIEDSSYTWWLKERVQERSDADGNCEPMFDFCYLDGAHDWTIDGLSVVLIERLLRPGGWLLLDDLQWTYADSVRRPDTYEGHSEAEATQPNLAAVFELIVKPHPAFTEFVVQDGWWAWARKAPGEPRRLRLEVDGPWRLRLSRALSRARRRTPWRRR
jgi:predicted O-methyltransferase YrrM